MASDLHISRSSVQRIVKKELKLNSYKLSRGRFLTDSVVADFYDYMKWKSSSTQQVSVDVEKLVLKKNDNKAKEDNTSMENCDTGKEQENRCCPSRNEEYIHHERFCLKLLSSIKKIIANMPDEMVDMKTFENILEYCVELDQLDKNFLHSLSLGDTNIFNIFKDRFSEQFIIVLKGSKGYIRKKGNVRNVDTVPDENMNTMTSINCNTPNGVQQSNRPVAYFYSSSSENEDFDDYEKQCVNNTSAFIRSEEIESVKSQHLKWKCSSISDHSSEYQSRRNGLENVSNRPNSYFYSSSSENEDFDDYEKQCVNNTSAFIQTSHRSAIGDKKCGLCSLAATKLHKTISEMEEMRKKLEIKENEYMEKLKSPIGDANDKRKEYLKKENELMDIINSLKANEATLKNQLNMKDSQLTSAIRNIEMWKQDTGLMVTQRDAELFEARHRIVLLESENSFKDSKIELLLQKMEMLENIIEVQNANRKDVQVKPLVSASPLQAVQAEDQKTAGKTTLTRMSSNLLSDYEKELKFLCKYISTNPLQEIEKYFIDKDCVFHNFRSSLINAKVSLENNIRLLSSNPTVDASLLHDISSFLFSNDIISEIEAAIKTKSPVTQRGKDISSNKERNCLICFSLIKAIDPVIQCDFCKNKIHEECGTKWLDSKETCIVCRSSLPNPLQFPRLS